MCSQSLPCLSALSMLLSSLSDQRVPFFCAQQCGQVSSSLSEAAGSGGRDERRRFDSEAEEEKGDRGDDTAGVLLLLLLASSFTSQAVSEMRKLAVVVDGSDRWREAVSMTDCTAERDDGEVDSDRRSVSAAVCPSTSVSRSISLLAVDCSAVEVESAARVLLPFVWRLLLVDVDAGEAVDEENDEVMAAALTGD